MSRVRGGSTFWSKVMARARKLFVARNRFGVFGYGIGRRTRRGLPTRELTLVVYLPIKIAKPRHAVPTIRVMGRTIVPDIIATGTKPSAHAGQAAFDGMHPGGAIVTQGGARGAISALLMRIPG